MTKTLHPLMTAEMIRGLQLASLGSPDSLQELKTFPISVRNTREVFESLGHVTGAGMAHVIKYIIDQVWAREPVTVYAVHALSSLNIHPAEKVIVDLAALALDDKTHPEHISIRSEVIKALENMETETSADRIQELGKTYDVLAPYAISSLGNLYEKNSHIFGSAYRRMLQYATNPDVMDNIISAEWGAGGSSLLAEAFRQADERKIFGNVQRGAIENLEAAWRVANPSGYCTGLYNLARSIRVQKAELQATEEVRNAILAARDMKL